MTQVSALPRTAAVPISRSGGSNWSRGPRPRFLARCRRRAPSSCPVAAPNPTGTGRSSARARSPEGFCPGGAPVSEAGGWTSATRRRCATASASGRRGGGGGSHRSGGDHQRPVEGAAVEEQRRQRTRAPWEGARAWRRLSSGAAGGGRAVIASSITGRPRTNTSLLHACTSPGFFNCT